MKKLILLLFIILGIFLSSCSSQEIIIEDTKLTKLELDKLSVATFAGGCFWCTESDFEKVPGVKEAISGYTGGDITNAKYKDVSAGKTAHREAVQVYYDRNEVTYEELLDTYWRHNDPTDAGGSFYDRGYQYTSAIYYHNDEQKEIATKSLQLINSSKIFTKPIVTSIEAVQEFYEAEEYHQDYHNKNPIRYNAYRKASGRDEFTQSVWGEK